MNTWILQPVFKVYFVLLISSILSLSCLYTDCSDESHKADSIAEHRLKLRNSIEKEVLNRVKLIIFYLFYFIISLIVSYPYQSVCCYCLFQNEKEELTVQMLLRTGHLRTESVFEGICEMQPSERNPRYYDILYYQLEYIYT